MATNRRLHLEQTQISSGALADQKDTARWMFQLGGGVCKYLANLLCAWRSNFQSRCLTKANGIHTLKMGLVSIPFFFSLASWAHGHTVTHSISAKASFGRLWRCAQRAWANGSEWQSCAVWAIHVGIYFGQAGGVVSPYMNLGFKPAFVGFLNGQMRPKSKSANSIGLEIQFLELLLLCMGH